MEAAENKGYWNSLEPYSKAYPTLKRDIKTDVLIVGGGINGCLTSYYLSTYNIETVLIEKGLLAHSNTSRSPFALQYSGGRMLIDMIREMSRADAIRLFRLGQKSVDEIEHILWEFGKLCGFERKESLIITSDLFELQHLKEEYTCRKSLDFNVDLLNEEELEHRYRLKGVGALSVGDCAQMDPFRFSHVLIKTSFSKGCQVFENTELKSFEYQKNGKIKVTTPEACIECSKIVFTAGTDIKYLLHDERINLKNYLILVTSLNTGNKSSLASCIVNIVNGIRIIFRATEDSRIIAAAENSTRKSKDEIVEIINRIYPEFSTLKIDYCCDGLYAESNSNIPFIGRYKNYPDCYFNIGIGRNSEVYGIIGAQIIKDLILYKNCPDEKIFNIKK